MNLRRLCTCDTLRQVQPYTPWRRNNPLYAANVTGERCAALGDRAASWPIVAVILEIKVSFTSSHFGAAPARPLCRRGT